MRLKKLMSILLVLGMLGVFRPCTAASELEYDRVLWERETELTPDIRLVETVCDNGSRQAEHYIVFRPGGEARPSLSYGTGIREKLSFPEAAARSPDRVLAGINGDYFVMSTGMPLGIVIHDGELISSDAGNAAFGFLEDGSMILGMPAVVLTLRSDTVSVPVGSINKTFRAGEFCLYTSDWGEAVSLSEGFRCLELIAEKGQKLTLGGEYNLISGAARTAEYSVPLEEGKLLLCYSGPDEAWAVAGLDDLTPGTSLTLEAQASDERFTDCREALGCLYPLLMDGEVLPGLDDIDKSKAPRTALGVREDGTVIFYTADGRQAGYAIGLTLQEMALRLRELGCKIAGALDGGASTVMACQLPGEEECAVRNSPSLGHLRDTPQFLLLTARYADAGELETIGVFSEEKLMLAGSRMSLSCGGCDGSGSPLPLNGLRWRCDEGAISEDGVYIAPDTAGEVTVTAECGGVSGSLRIPVIEQPGELRIFSEEESLRQLRVLPGSETALSVQAFWNGLPVCASNELFLWEVEGEIGSVDASGLFTASDRAAAGALIVRFGEISCRLPIQVTDTVICAEDFEDAPCGEVPGLKWSPESNRDRVKYGRGSLRLDYDLSQGSVTLPMSEYPTELGSHAAIWVLSDGSGSKVYSVHDEISILLGTLEQSGWMQFSVNTETFGRIRALRIDGQGSGTLWLDQLLVYSLPEPDLEAPVVRLDLSDDRLTAQVWDQTEGILPASMLELTVDGKTYPFDYDPTAGMVSAELPRPGRSIHVMLSAWDRSGNYHSASVLVENGTDPAFPDMAGHWANRYVTYLRDLGVVSGRLAEDGSTYYDPDARITRAEFAVMLCRWLGLDTGAYGNELRFADGDMIPSWAYDSVRTAAALGLIYGAAESDGLYFMPQQPLTRAQAAVILGRTMPGGRMLSDLPWPDADDIPLWARSYVSELAFMGVMNGNGITFEPNEPLTRAQAAKLLSELS